MFTRTQTIGDEFDCGQEPDNEVAGYASIIVSRHEVLREHLCFGRLSLLSLKTIDDGLSSQSRLGVCILQQTLPNFLPNKKDLEMITEQ